MSKFISVLLFCVAVLQMIFSSVPVDIPLWLMAISGLFAIASNIRDLNKNKE